VAFTFAIVQPGLEAQLKADVAREHGGALRPAYARPGLVTWKGDRERDVTSPFARVRGAGIGTFATAAEIAAAAPPGELRLHAYARDAKGADHDPLAADLARAAALEAELRSLRPFLPGSEAQDGDRVLDVIVGGDDPAYVGVHVQREGAIPFPGGRFAIDVPPDAPSRAYRKLEEMLAWSGLEPREGDVAVELGAAPGGASYALARRGVSVVAIDPAPLDPRVLAYVGPGGARVTHVAKAAGALRGEVPRSARWLLVDVNLAPPVALRYLARVAAKIDRRRLEGVIATLKLNDARMAADVPRWLEKLRELGPFDVRAVQLASHRREIGAVAAGFQVAV
jgi:23S rRNA (cytidine2498-2'-O)-methyltransferase